MHRNLRIATCLPVLACLVAIGADTAKEQRSDKQALARLQSYVGSWKGVGQVRRGSNEGSWIEQSDWVWKFGKQGPSITFTSPKAKYFQAGSFHPTEEPGKYRLVVKRSEKGEPIEYLGSLDEADRLTLVVEQPAAGVPDRITIRQVAAGKRLVVLYERRIGTSNRFSRLAEVGSTRKGSGFGKGVTFVECVVTGGLGTIAVMHEGKTYYVCCTGCRDHFNEDPATVLAEYHERKAAEKKKAAAEKDAP